MFDYSKFNYFIQIKPTTGDVSFSSYTDMDGNTYQAYQSYDARGDHRKFWITFSVRERTYRCAKDRMVLVSKNGDVPERVSLSEFLKNSSFTEGSPNLRGEPLIKIFDEVKDASTAVDRKKRRLEAGNIALGLSTEETTQMANLIGVYNDDKMVQKNRVLEFADQDPEYFMKLYNSGDREARAVLKKGLESSVLKRKGKMVTWESTTLGADEDEAVANLMKDPKLLDSVKKAVKRLK